jgi:hypothetical protein
MIRASIVRGMLIGFGAAVFASVPAALLVNVKFTTLRLVYFLAAFILAGCWGLIRSSRNAGNSMMARTCAIVALGMLGSVAISVGGAAFIGYGIISEYPELINMDFDRTVAMYTGLARGLDTKVLAQTITGVGTSLFIKSYAVTVTNPLASGTNQNVCTVGGSGDLTVYFTSLYATTSVTGGAGATLALVDDNGTADTIIAATGFASIATTSAVLTSTAHVTIKNGNHLAIRAGTASLTGGVVNIQVFGAATNTAGVPTVTC